MQIKNFLFIHNLVQKISIKSLIEYIIFYVFLRSISTGSYVYLYRITHM